jgi:hypothetical protein
VCKKKSFLLLSPQNLSQNDDFNSIRTRGQQMRGVVYVLGSDKSWRPITGVATEERITWTNLTVEERVIW